MNAVKDSGPTGGCGRVWLAIPALWLIVGIAGFVALSRWPQLFA